MSNSTRVVISLVKGSELYNRLFEYNKHERSIVIKHALMDYFSISGAARIGNVVSPKVEAQHGSVVSPARPSDPGRDAINVMGDFGD